MNYNEPIRAEHLDLNSYKTKFAYVDKVRRLTNPHPKYLKAIWDDPTKFAYMFLRNNDNQPLKLYPYQDAILNDTHDRIYFRASNQLGKAEYINNLIPTKNGFEHMKNIKVGDYVFDRFGVPTKVTGIPFEGHRPCYKLTFDDGSNIIVAKEHEWICKPTTHRFGKEYTYNRGKNKGQKFPNPKYNKWTTLSTEEIIKVGRYEPETIPRLKVSIPVTEPILYGKQDLKVDPYIVGLLLGDGCMTTDRPNFVSGDIQLAKTVSWLTGGPILNKNSKAFTINIPKVFVPKLKKENLIGYDSSTKYIPIRYLTGSVEQRTSLLRGLMDTDGSVYGKTATLEYCTVSEQLKSDFIELINSLGGVVNKVNKKKPWYYNNEQERVYCKPAYSIRFRIDINPFTLERKAKKFKPVKVHRKERLIERVEFVGDLPTKCISVESEDHSYVSGYNYIVTHNSFLFNVKAVWNLIRDHGHAHNEAIVSKSLPQSTYQMQRVKQLLKTMKVNWKAEGEGKTGQDSMTKITYDINDKDGNLKYTNMLVCTPCTEGLLGYDLHDLNLDEFEYWVDVDLGWFYKQIAQPRLYTTKGNILVMTNPNGGDNYGAELELQLDLQGNKRFHNYIFNFLDCPTNTQPEYDQLKHELSRQEFESTVAAIRSISSLAYFSPGEIHGSLDTGLKQLDMVGKQPFFFLDVAAKHDRACLVGGYVDYPDISKNESDQFAHIYIPIIHHYPQGYPLTRVAGVSVDESDGWHHERSVAEYLKEWSVDGIMPVFGFDVTGNSGMKALFEAINIDAEDITFSGPNKSGMYQRFKYFMEKGLLHRIKHTAWEEEASQLIATKGVRGYLLINAASHVRKGGKKEDAALKRIPDDTMDATAGFIQLCDPMGTVEPSLTVI